MGGCGVTDEVIQWMERIQNSGVDDDPPVSATPSHTYHSPAPNQPHPNSLRDDSSRYINDNVCLRSLTTSHIA